MSSAVKILPHYTFSDYGYWEGKWELIDGVPYAMSPSPTPRHQAVAGNLHAVLWHQLRNCHKGQVLQPVDYVISDDIVVQPDVLVVCREITKRFLDFPPQLVAEVLLPATRLKDRHTKFDIYEKQGIRYYIILDTELNEAEVFEWQQGKYIPVAKGNSPQYEFNLDECKARLDFS